MLRKLLAVERVQTLPPIALLALLTLSTLVTAADIKQFTEKHLYNEYGTILPHRIEKLLRGSIASAAARELAEGELKNASVAVQSRRRRQQSDRRQI